MNVVDSFACGIFPRPDSGHEIPPFNIAFRANAFLKPLPKKAPPFQAALSFSMSAVSYLTSSGMMSRATMLMILMSGLMAGPAVSL